MTDIVTIFVPTGYRNAKEFLKDCGFEPAHAHELTEAFDLRKPSKPDYADALQVTVRRRSLIERLQGAAWLVFRRSAEAPQKARVRGGYQPDAGGPAPRVPTTGSGVKAPAIME